MTEQRRLDTELVRRGIARSREHAVGLIRDGTVRLDDRVATKASSRINPDTPMTLGQGATAAVPVSRGAAKLGGALEALSRVVDPERRPGLGIRGRRCLDAGASTGGFTEVLLDHGAREVVAVDVGHGQLSQRLRTDSRVRVHEGTNVRDLRAGQIGGTVDLVVADLSFISLTIALPALVEVCASDVSGADDADMLLMVKPQFEVGRGRLGSGGVVRDPTLRVHSVWRVASCAATYGWGVEAVTPSPLPGPAGNVEYFLWLRQGAPAPDQDRIAAAVTEGSE